MLFFKMLEKGVFFQSWGSENVHFQEKVVVFIKADLVWAQTCLRGQICYKIAKTPLFRGVFCMKRQNMFRGQFQKWCSRMCTLQHLSGPLGHWTLFRPARNQSEMWKSPDKWTFFTVLPLSECNFPCNPQSLLILPIFISHFPVLWFSILILSVSLIYVHYAGLTPSTLPGGGGVSYIDIVCICACL